MNKTGWSTHYALFDEVCGVCIITVIVGTVTLTFINTNRKKDTAQTVYTHDIIYATLTNTKAQLFHI